MKESSIFQPVSTPFLALFANSSPHVPDLSPVLAHLLSLRELPAAIAERLHSIPSVSAAIVAAASAAFSHIPLGRGHDGCGHGHSHTNPTHAPTLAPDAPATGSTREGSTDPATSTNSTGPAPAAEPAPAPPSPAKQFAASAHHVVDDLSHTVQAALHTNMAALHDVYELVLRNVHELPDLQALVEEQYRSWRPRLHAVHVRVPVWKSLSSFPFIFFLQ